MKSPSFFYYLELFGIMKGERFMQLQGKAINHVKFGNGIIRELRDKYLIVDFVHGERKFLFPNVFAGFLSLIDHDAQLAVESIIDDVITKEKNEIKEEINEQERIIRIQKLKVHPSSQVAFGLIQNNKKEVFESWSVFSGEYLSGDSKGEPKQPIRMKLNSACLLTECAKGELEKERRIIGAFMVRDDFDGRTCNDGQIESHKTYRFRLNESEMLPYYKYFETNSKVYNWGNTEYKYFSNEIMQCILKDIQKVIMDENRLQAVNEFYQYFCYVNRLKETENTELNTESSTEELAMEVKSS